ncbi:hypothetical protein DL98DRAFT_591935 [Cadophora sp. DSE1049]|nr:hypothetical protein DL98DRAFT_591935 [Cadophora sp. DSE1049]
MLPQEPRESYAWDDSCFNDWIKPSPDASTYPHTDDIPSSRRIRIPDLLSSPTPTQSAAPSIAEDSMVLDLTKEPVRRLVRSPRSSDLVGLCRRNSIPSVEGDNNVNMHSIDNRGNMEFEHKDRKGKGKARETNTSEDYGTAQCYPKEEWEGFWKEYKMQARSLKADRYNYDDRGFDMNFTEEYRRARIEEDDIYLMSPPQHYLGPRSSPTWGRGREGTSSPDFNYDHMAIEELMKGMEVYSDTDYEQTEEISDLPRILFGRSCSPGIGSSKSYGVTTDRKRKASQSLEEPNCKKRYIANPLRGGSFRSSVKSAPAWEEDGQPMYRRTTF